jgi:CheY-like chemotaxis protein
MAPFRILVADDDEDMRSTVAFTLLDEGHVVEEVASGNDVLRRVEKSIEAGADAGGYDLVVMDIRMPGLSGLDTVRRLHALRSAPPVILMTAFASPGIIDDAQTLRVPLLSKPFTLGELRRLAQATLRRSRDT